MSIVSLYWLVLDLTISSVFALFITPDNLPFTIFAGITSTSAVICNQIKPPSKLFPTLSNFRRSSDSFNAYAQISSRALRQSLMMSQGDLSILGQRPISAIMLGLAVVLLLSPLLGRVNRARVKAITEGG